ncbi:MAG: adenylate/guanylate cyclase domain-containing protein [Elusimicrobiota bacterium]|nr:adenylate/guanylate cyclase domain-containing protein [Elusimicrobiota bacterium]
MSFRHKLLAAFLGLLAGVLGLSLLVIQRLETRRAEDELSAGLELTKTLFDDILLQHDRELASSLKLLSGDFAFKQAVATGEPATVASAAANHRARMGADLLLVTGEDGALLADTRRARPEAGRKAPALMRPVLEDGRGVSGIFVLDGEAYQLAAVAIKAPDAIGVVAAGFRIDDRFAESLKRLTRTEVSFLVDGMVAGSTLSPEDRTALAGYAPSLAAAPRRLTFGRERFLAVASQTRPPVAAVVMRSWDEALRPLRSLQKRLLLIGLAGLAAAGFLGLFIAKGLTASLDQLVTAAGRIAEGRYDIELRIPSTDEIGRLGRAFADMARGLLEREKIRSILHKSVSKEIAESLVSRGQIELGGEEKDVTVLFSDIRSFTTISESLPPKELVAQLNDYFTGMARAIDAHHGVIDKYIGDAVMALFGAPLSRPDDAANALKAALAMRDALDALNARRAERGLPAWKNGVGVNTGRVVAGTLGSEERWSYTVIGDAVNVASRLESVTKELGAPIIASARTKELAGPGFRWRALGRVTVKGKTEDLEVFELLGTDPA